MASYNALIIQTQGVSVSPYLYAELETDGYLKVDEFDHAPVKRYSAKAMRVYSKRAGESSYTRILSVKDAPMDVIVTDCRVVFRCNHYDNNVVDWKGGLAAAALNAIEDRKLKKRTSGKALIGHVRYEWIRELGYSGKNKDGKQAPDSFCIRVVYADMENTRFLIEAAFSVGENTSEIANLILKKTCRFRLAMKNGYKNKEFFEKYQKETIEEKPDTDYYRILFPNSFHAPDGEKCRPEAFEAEKEKLQKQEKKAPDATNAGGSFAARKVMAQSSRQLPAGSDKWRCTCGKINPNTTGTCSCGVKKRELAAAKPSSDPAPRAGARRPGAAVAPKPVAEKKPEIAPKQPETANSPEQNDVDEMQVIALIKQYKSLMEAGVITEEEFAEKKKELLNIE